MRMKLSYRPENDSEVELGNTEYINTNHASSRRETFLCAQFKIKWNKTRTSSSPTTTPKKRSGQLKKPVQKHTRVTAGLSIYLIRRENSRKFIDTRKHS